MAHGQIPGIDLTARPSRDACVECLAADGPGWWFHLRRCGVVRAHRML